MKFTARKLTFVIALAFTFLWLGFGIALSAFAAPPITPDHRPLELHNAVQDKNFYLLSLFERDATVRRILRKSSVLQQLTAVKEEAMKKGFLLGEKPDESAITALEFSPTEIESVSKELIRLYEAEPEMRRLVDGPLRRSGVGMLAQNQSSAGLLDHVWRNCAAGINNIIAVYGLGHRGRSPEIDSMFYDPKSQAYTLLIHHALGVQAELADKDELFFQPGLEFALTLLDFNRRDEAGRMEPLERGENRKALRRIASIRWDRYPYSVILVPGDGPEEKEVQLSPIGKQGLKLAAQRYRQGKAPFIVTSGGYVHPKQTPYCEALEMKHSLMHEFGIPEDAIIIDPHARHTTTNLRNTARLIYRYSIPFDRPGLVTSNSYQSEYIGSKELFDRCQRIFGYVPYTIVRRTSPFDLEFLPKIESLETDSIDPLDP